MNKDFDLISGEIDWDLFHTKRSNLDILIGAAAIVAAVSVVYFLASIIG